MPDVIQIDIIVLSPDDAQALAEYRPGIAGELENHRRENGFYALTRAEVEQLKNQFPARQKGLGDLVHAVLNPIAKAIGIEHCSGCEDRREILNKISLPESLLANKSKTT